MASQTCVNPRLPNRGLHKEHTISKYLVTGAGGFIGSYITRRLLSDGHQVVILDNMSTGQPENLPTGAEYIHADISRPEGIAVIPEYDFDAVFHLAAQSSGEISHEDPGRDLNTNALGTLLLLEWCQRQGVNRFLNASSMAVYGLTEMVPVVETQSLEPYSYYGISKLASEHYVRHFAKHGMRTTIFRMFNVYGPTQNLANMKQGMVSIYLAYLLEGRPVLVKGSLDRYRDFIFIDDVVDGWLAALDDANSYGQTFNLGSGRKTLVKELLEELIRAWGHDPGSYPIEYGEGTPGDQFGIYADISSISKALEWSPRVSLADGLSRMATWANGLAKSK